MAFVNDLECAAARFGMPPCIAKVCDAGKGNMGRFDLVAVPDTVERVPAIFCDNRFGVVNTKIDKRRIAFVELAKLDQIKRQIGNDFSTLAERGQDVKYNRLERLTRTSRS